MNKKSLNEEVEMLHSLAVSLVGKDREGAYRPAFVRKVLKAAHARPTRRFSDVAAFLKELESGNA